MSRLRRTFAVVALALVLAPLAANAPLFDPDEGLHAAIAQEMVQRGDYITPTFLGEPFLDKPILFFWTEAVSLRVFGMREAAVRVPPLCFGLLGMLAVAWLGRELFDESAGLTAGIVYGTMLLPLGVSEVAVHDVAVVPFMCAAAALLVSTALPPEGIPPEGGSYQSTFVASAFRRNAIVAGIALGLSILTKGLVAIVFTGILGVCLAVYRPSAIRRIGTFLIVAGVVAVLVALPWYLLMERAHPGYLHYYFIERHLQGYLTATQRHAGRPWWYYIPVVLGGALPWTGYLAGAGRSVRGPGLRLVVWAWFAIGLVFLSAGESKLVTYALPLFPAIAIVTGEFVDRHTVRYAFTLHALVLAIVPPAALFVLQTRYAPVHPFLWMSIAIFSLMTIYSAYRARRSARPYGFVAWIARMTVFAMIGMMAAAVSFASWMTGKDLAAMLNSAGTLPPHISILDERVGSVVFYLDPPLRAQLTPDRIDEASLSEAIGRMRVAPPDALLAVRDNRLARFTKLFASPPLPDARAGTFTVFRADSIQQALQRQRNP